MTIETPSFATGHRGRESRVRLRAGTRLVRRFLPEPEVGSLRLVLPSGDMVVRRGARSGPDATLVISRWRALWRIALSGETGFSDGFLAGDWSTPDLERLLCFAALNEHAWGRHADDGIVVLTWRRMLHGLRRNTRRGSRRNIAAHYDLGNDFYRRWLDRGMNYSSALYDGDETLEDAQTAKLERICELLEPSPGRRVLEIGIGWGALAERLVRECQTNLTGLTLSSEQLAFARSRLAPEVDSGRADLRLQDYRDVSGRYDRIVSVEMLEAVGEQYWPKFFARLNGCLAETGVAVLQVITICDGRYDAYRKRPDYIQRHIFPGGMLPTPAIIVSQAAQAGLAVVRHETFGESYAKTLVAWRDRFVEAWPQIEALGFDQRFRRMWEYYLTYCEVGFRLGYVDVGLFKLVPVANSTKPASGKT